ncbi:MAG: cation exchanger 1 [Monoraphidium minutum]|nr:MAG: cation exchanger 1 [Monoraphidium minutum]
MHVMHETYALLRHDKAAAAAARAAAWPPGRGTSFKSPLKSRPVTPVPSDVAWYVRDAVALRDMLTASYFSLLLVCFPLGIAAAGLSWGAVPVFTLNFLALVPLALLLGDVTEDLALRFGDVVGGLLNATFGNVVEMIISIAALMKGLYTVVATSLLGSILSNLLLVLGCCFFFGGLRYQVQSFNATANQATSSLLFLSCIAIIIPTAATNLGGGGGSQEAILSISRGTAVVLLIIYACYLVFQLKSHHDLFRGDDGGDDPTLTLVTSVAALAAITAAVAVSSELLTGAIEAFTQQTGLSQAFVGMIILPIAGNACEHIVAVMVAVKGKMDLAMGVAVGSSIQIALLAIPTAVVVGWAAGRPFSLDFPPFATLALVVSVLHANLATGGGSSHWLMGVELIATYTLIAMTFLFVG